MANKIQILPDGLTGDFILVKDVDGRNPDEYYSKKAIVKAMGIYQDSPKQYNHETKTVVNFDFQDGSRWSLEAQDIDSQPTWSDGTLAGLNLAIVGILTI